MREPILNSTEGALGGKTTITSSIYRFGCMLLLVLQRFHFLLLILVISVGGQIQAVEVNMAFVTLHLSIEPPLLDCSISWESIHRGT